MCSFRMWKSGLRSISAAGSCSACRSFDRSRCGGSGSLLYSTIRRRRVVGSGGRFFGSAADRRCWNCGAEAFLFCGACRSVQPAGASSSVDYFQIFGMRREYRIELGELERRYKDWQKKLHPDLVHSKSQREREYAAEQSARVIEAYRTLADHLSRATYILKLAGVAVDEEERITDPQLLAEIMELREAVDEADDEASLTKIQADLQDKFEGCSSSFERAYEDDEYEEALGSVRRMTYYKRAGEEILKKL